MESGWLWEGRERVVVGVRAMEEEEVSGGGDSCPRWDVKAACADMWLVHWL